ncbi:hypothetical protein [Georgenia sp. SYP-B2076]|uniref:hypothetical protein n=1 Tax=Georgenia sp. SYP-B2076 TaxID=2495881 RepID=UPI000F8E49CE|nr:hypothetical protein [Georgenia sp. SYP-B2076]
MEAPPCETYSNLGGGQYHIDLSGCFTEEQLSRLGGNFVVGFTPGDPAIDAAPPVVVTREDLQRLPIAPGALVVQPDRGWVLVNMDTIVWVETGAQTFSTVVLDTPVQVRVEPVDYTWGFGDGSAPLRTTDPGAPYPDHSVSHPYTRAAADARVTLTTRWVGEFQVDGSGVWQPVAGFATTQESSAPFEVRTAHAALTTR